MPLPPPPVAIPLDTVDVAMNSARVALNDCPLALSGNLLANTQPYAQQIANNGWRAFQRDLADQGEANLTGEILIQALPPVATIDPAAAVYLNQAQYYDGAQVWTPPSVAVLPQNFMMPLKLKERLAGTQALFTDMRPVDDGLPNAPKTTYLRLWEWRAGFDRNGNQIPLSIWMPGATVARDLLVRCALYAPDFQTVGGLQWYQQPISIPRCADVLGFYIAAAFAFSRGSVQANATEVGNGFLANGKAAMRQLMNQSGKIRQRINHRRRSYSASRHQGWSWW